MRSDNIDDAEELLQDVFLRSWTQLHQFDPGRAFSTWLYTLAARLAASRWRRRRLPAATDRELAEVESDVDPAAVVEQLEQRRNLWDLALRVLGAEPRTALWLFYGEGRSACEIGVILNKREDAVRAMLFRARGRLASHLRKPATCSRDR
jgi:RNA polymerase sigma-70 factor (ECF subfamily)